VRYTSVPVLTFASLCGELLSKCQDHKEHWKIHGSSVAFASDVWFRQYPQAGTKRQVRYTRVRSAKGLPPAKGGGRVCCRSDHSDDQIAKREPGNLTLQKFTFWMTHPPPAAIAPAITM